MSQKHNLLLSVLVFLLLFLAIIHISYFFFLPRYIERNLLPDLGLRLSASLSGKVYNLGLSSADFGEIILGSSQNPAVNIGLIHADYSLSSLLTSHKLNSLTVNGLSLQLKFAEGKLLIPGLNLEKYSAQGVEGQSQASSPSDSIKLPVMLGSFEVKNGLLFLIYEDQHLLFPFDLLIKTEKQPDEASSPIFRIRLTMLSQGKDISVDGLVDLAANKGNFSLTAPSIDLNRILVMGGVSSDNILVGSGSIMAKADINLAPFQLREVQIKGGLDPVEVKHIPIRFASAENIPDKKEAALSLDIKKEGDNWLIQINAAISEPLETSLELQSSLIMAENRLLSKGNFILKMLEESHVEKQTKSLLGIANFPEFQGNFVFDYGNNGTWQTTIESPPAKTSETETFQASYSGIDLVASMPSITFKGSGNTQQDDLELALNVAGLRAGYDKAEIKTPRLNLKASYRQDKDQGLLKPGVMIFEIRANNTEMKQNGLSGRADISLQGQVEQSAVEKNIYRTAGTVTLNKGEINEAKNNLRIGGVEGKIPWQWPAATQENFGQIKIADIHFDDYDLGNFRGDLRLREMTYYLDGSYTSSMLPGLMAAISGRAEIASSGLQGEIAVRIEPTLLDSLQLGKFHPSLDKAYFSGLIGLESTLQFDGTGFKGKVQGRVQQGRFAMPEKNYSVENIDISFLLPLLPDLRSAPAQKFSFEKASLGDLVFEDGKIIWQLESSDSVLIEESSFHWAGGRVFTSAVRATAGMKNLVIPIFCDRLKLADLLEQFGVSNAKGEGTVSGRIPVTVGSNTVNFEDGFLYSSPGHGGSVRVAAFDTLVAGIPKNTPQFAQVDFAAEALKNFSYNWVKLLFNTEGEELVMQMQMDGKPVQSLPFRYDSKTGMLQRIDDAAKGIDQPIMLEVNFRLPLNRFLGYSGRIQDIMKKMK
jgi:Dicarboxylate transport